MVPSRAFAPLALLGLLALAGCDRSAAPDRAAQSAGTPTAAERVLRRGNGGDPGSLDPQAGADHYGQEIQRDLYEGLTSEAADGLVIPGVAERWSVSPDGLTYRFVLRAPARWSDGSPVLAEHFVAAFRRAVDPRTISPAADLFRVIANAEGIVLGQLEAAELGVVALGPNELEVRLENPVPFFPALVTHPAFSPRHPSPPVARGVEQPYAVSNGPYRFHEWIPNGQIVVVRNPHYWDRAAVQIDRVVYYPIAAESEEFLRYRAGDLDITAAVPANQIANLQRERPGELVMAPYLGTYFIGLNLQRTPFFGNADLRRALSLAIDRDALAQQVLKGTQAPAYGLVPAGTAGFEPQSHPWASTPIEERRALARTLYARATAGHTEPIRVRLIYGSSQLVRSVLVAVAAMWKETLGLEVEIVTEEFRVYLDTQRDPNRWEALRFAWVADYNDASTFLELFRQGNPSNVFGYANPRFDALLAQAQRTLDPTARAQLLQEAERLLLEEQAFIPVFHMLSKRLVSPRVVGFQMTPLNRIYSRHLQLRD